MCGIFGIINFNGKPVDISKAERAAKTVAHRGPDDYGTFISPSGSTFLCNYRLSIIDLSPLGHQPMTTPDGRYTIVYNGEIYNYVELSQKSIRHLPDKSQKLKSHSDTEIILYLFAEYGSECLNMLRGMFAFTVWDEKEKTLFCARDRFGIKPFYYLLNEKEFIFSSELKAIKKYKNNLTVSETSVTAFLKTGSVPAPITFYEEVNSLLPGNYLKINSSGKAEIKEYWSFPDLLNDTENLRGLHSDDGTLTSKVSRLKYDEDAKRKIRESLLDSITAHCVADVEVGAFLSGGVDSSSIVSLMRQAGHEKIKTISVAFPGSELDESKYSLSASKKYNTSHYEYRLKEEELVDDLDRIFEVMDQPTIDGVNTYFVSKAAHNFGLKVVMSGLGGDELFGGYSTFRYLPLLEKINKIPLSGTVQHIAALAAKPFVKPKVYEYLNNNSDTNASYRLFRGLFTSRELNCLGLKNNYNDVTLSLPARLLAWSKGNISNGSTANQHKLTPLQYVSYLETTNYMSNQLLRDSDIFSMAHSIELRVPFVDDRLYSVVLKYIDKGYNKHYLKRMLVEAVGDLPESIVNRKKMGFTFPFDEWMRKGKLGKIVRESIASPNASFKRSGVEELIKNFDNNKVHWSRLWALFVLSKYI